jgi:hypothetical protein
MYLKAYYTAGFDGPVKQRELTESTCLCYCLLFCATALYGVSYPVGNTNFELVTPLKMPCSTDKTVSYPKINCCVTATAY